MLAPPSKEHLPAHSRDVCPWGSTCPVHAGPTFADVRRTDARRLSRKTLRNRPLKACHKCGQARPEGLKLKREGTTRPVCRACYDARHMLFGVGMPRTLRERLFPAVPA